VSGPDDDQRDEALRAAIREAEQGRPEYLIFGLRDTRRTLPAWFRLWLAAVLDPNGKTEFVARLTMRTLRRRGRPKSTAPLLPGPENMVLVSRFVDLLRRLLRSPDVPLDPSTRLMLARWFDPQESTFVRATIGRRSPGAPSRPSQRILRAAYYVVVNIGADPLEPLLEKAIEMYSGKHPISKSQLLAHIRAHWPGLLPAASEARARRRRARRKIK
jgi:hypothetical protein